MREPLPSFTLLEEHKRQCQARESGLVRRTNRDAKWRSRSYDDVACGHTATQTRGWPCSSWPSGPGPRRTARCGQGHLIDVQIDRRRVLQNYSAARTRSRDARGAGGMQRSGQRTHWPGPPYAGRIRTGCYWHVSWVWFAYAPGAVSRCRTATTVTGLCRTYKRSTKPSMATSRGMGVPIPDQQSRRVRNRRSDHRMRLESDALFGLRQPSMTRTPATGSGAHGPGRGFGGKGIVCFPFNNQRRRVGPERAVEFGLRA